MRAQDDMFETWMQPGVEAFNYWISFFPTAPLFGVEWRFGESMGSMMPMAAMGFAVGKPEASGAEIVSISTARARVSGGDVKEAEVIQPAEPSVTEKPKAKKAVAKEEIAPKAETAPVAKPKPEAAVMAASETANGASAAPKGLLKKAPADADDLKKIKGIGPGLEAQLNDLGIYRFRQLSKFKDADLAWVDANLTSFKGRCFRDDWVSQAKHLIR